MTRRLIPALLLASTSLLSGATAYAATGGYSFQPRDWTMPSGYRLLYLDDGRFGIVHMSTSFPVGMVDSPDARPDLAHVAQTVWLDSVVEGHSVRNWLTSMGCSWSASTGLDVTSFSTSCPVSVFDGMVKLHRDLLSGGFEGVTQEHVDVAAAMNERRYRWQDSSFSASPYYRLMRNTLFSPDHPYHLKDTGTASFAGTTLDEVNAFVTEHYVPGEAVTAFLGDVTQAELAHKLIERFPASYFHPDLSAANLTTYPADDVSWLGQKGGEISWYPNPDEPSEPLDYVRAKDPRQRKAPLPPEGPHMTDIERDFSIKTDTVLIGWSLPGSNAYNYWPVERLGTWASAELKLAAERMKDVGRTWCSSVPGTEAGMMFCGIELKEKANAAKVIKAARGVFEDKWDETREEMLISSLALKDPLHAKLVERDASGAPVATAIGRHLLLTDHVDYFDRKYGQKGGAVISSVREAADSWLTARRASVVHVKAAAADETVDKSAKEMFGDKGEPTLPTMEMADDNELSRPISDRVEFELDNGMTVSLIAVRGLGQTYYNLIFPNPEDTRPATNWYTSRMFFRLPDSKKETLETVGYGGAVVAVAGRDDYTMLRTGSYNGMSVEELVAGFRTRLKASSPGDTPTGAEMTKWKADTMRGWNENYWLAQLLKTRFVAPDAIHGMDMAKVNEVQAIPESEMTTWFDSKFHPENAHLVVVGNLRSDVIRDALEDQVTKWKPRGEVTSKTRAPLTTFTPESSVYVWPTSSEHTVDVRYVCPLNMAENDLTKRWALGVTSSRLVNDDMRLAFASVPGLHFGTRSGYRQRWGGAELELELTGVPLADLPWILDTMRESVGDVADGDVSAERLSSSQQLVIDSVRMNIATGKDTMNFAIMLAGQGADLSVVDNAGEAVRGVTAGQAGSAVSACVGHETIIVRGGKDATVEALTAAGVKHEVYDWKEEKAARVESWDLGAAQSLIEKEDKAKARKAAGK